MSELTDDQLDGLFRKSAEEFETPFDQEAWRDMNNRLDAHEQTKPGGGLIWKNLLRWGLPVLLMLFVVGAWYVDRQLDPADQRPLVPASPGSASVLKPAVRENLPFKQSASIANAPGDRITPAETVRALTANQPAVINGPMSLNNRSGKAIREQTERNNSGTELTTERMVADSRPVRALTKPARGSTTTDKALLHPFTPNPYQVDQPATPIASRFSIRNKPTTNSLEWVASQGNKARAEPLDKGNISVQNKVESIATSGIEPQVTNSPDFILAGSKASSGSDKRIGLNEPETALAPLVSVKELKYHPAQWPKALTFTSCPVVLHPDTVATAMSVRPKLDALRGLSVRFVVAPDLSAVGLKNFARPGTNVGLLAEYRLAARWSVQAGVFQSTKVYKSLTSEYEVPSGWWKSPMKMPESVDGRCTLFDIPINVRYDVLVKPRLDGRLPNRWFVSGGITSYIMKNEDYYYTYPPHTYNQPVEYNVSSGGYGFSHANLSVGYERSINRRLSWQVEPFMKVPLKGVGFFKIRLISTGTFFSLRYKL